MKAVKALSELREKTGMKPDGVIVSVGDYKQLQWWAFDDFPVSIVIPPTLNIREFDARVLVGCDVTVVGDRNKRTHQVICKIIEHANSVTALTTTDPEDLGHVWLKGKGWRKIQHG